MLHPRWFTLGLILAVVLVLIYSRLSESRKR